MKKHTAGLKVEVELKEAWMHPGDHLSMAEAIVKLQELGNEILEVDEPGRRIKVAQAPGKKTKPERRFRWPGQRWVCDYCGSHSKSYAVITQHEKVCPARYC